MLQPFCSILTTVWKRSVVPDICLMRVPNNLPPFVMPTDLLQALTFQAYDTLYQRLTAVQECADSIRVGVLHCHLGCDRYLWILSGVVCKLM